MARRPVFVPRDGAVDEVSVEFDWHPGFARSQKQRSIAALHESALASGVGGPILEVSTKSPDLLGVRLSAFNLKVFVREVGAEVPLESAFQSAKVFRHGGRMRALLHASPIEAKRATQGLDDDLIAFDLDGFVWPLIPETVFYDYLYMSGLRFLFAESPELEGAFREYAAFTDIEFNPARSLNCQARSAALYVALASENRLGELASANDYLDRRRTGSEGVQGTFDL